ncbi:MAG: hypothetical protein UHU19_10140 [Lachnospiraceae bacterium]|nr:hypothetical protein [Lachnospiraceae bacterium]
MENGKRALINTVNARFFYKKFYRKCLLEDDYEDILENILNELEKDKNTTIEEYAPTPEY